MPVLDLDDPEQDETVQRLADRRTADLKALLELGLRRQAAADGKGVALDELEQLSGHGLCEALAERRLDLDVGHAPIIGPAIVVVHRLSAHRVIR